jgi:hypothetical protein
MKFTRLCLLLLIILRLPFILCAQAVNNGRPAGSSFISPDGRFRLEYSDSLVSCRRDPNQVNWWVPDHSCDAYTPVCSNFSGDSSETVACIAYPANEMTGTNFQAAAFSVNELKKVTDESECLKVEEPPPHVGTARNEIVNGVKFQVTETDGVGLGNFIDGYVYRNFHNRKCYELDIRIASSNIANYDPGTVKSFDSEKVQRALKAVLGSFRFIR